MRKNVFYAFMAFVLLSVSAACFTAFLASGRGELALVGTVSVFGTIGAAGCAIEGTAMGRRIGGMFAGEEDEP